MTSLSEMFWLGAEGTMAKPNAPRLVDGCWARASLGVILIFWLEASLSAARGACDLVPLVLPERSTPTNFAGRAINVRFGAKLEFSNSQDKVYTISESAFAKIDSAQRVISELIRDEVGSLPDDQCGSRAALGETAVASSSGSLVVHLPLKGEQWGCALGIKAKLASGTLLYTVILSPRVAESKLVLVPSVSQSGELVSTIPDIDPTLTATISDRLKDATTEAMDAVSNAVSRIQGKFDAISANLDDQTEAIRPIYHPKVTFIGFIQDGDSISLVQRRLARRYGMRF